MDWEVIWTQAAWSDLEEIADYIAKDSPAYAAAFVSEVREASRSLSTLAKRGRMVPEFQSPSVRELLMENYRMIYKTGKNSTYIIGFIHGARDLKASWKRMGRR
jgi:toxin ParE1/3/4